MERLKEQGAEDGKVRSLKNFTYNDKVIAAEIYAAMNSTQFLGVSVSMVEVYFYCVRMLKITCCF